MTSAGKNVTCSSVIRCPRCRCSRSPHYDPATRMDLVMFAPPARQFIQSTIVLTGSSLLGARSLFTYAIIDIYYTVTQDCWSLQCIAEAQSLMCMTPFVHVIRRNIIPTTQIRPSASSMIRSCGRSLSDTILSGTIYIYSGFVVLGGLSSKWPSSTSFSCRNHCCFHSLFSTFPAL